MELKMRVREDLPEERVDSEYEKERLNGLIACENDVKGAVVFDKERQSYL